MTVPSAILDLLKLREGWRTKVYLDSLGKPTCGMGHLLTEAEQKRWKVGQEVPVSELEHWADEDSQAAYRAAIAQGELIDCRDERLIHALTSVNFQLGTQWYTVFKRTWKLLTEHQWEAAALEVSHSHWYKQTPVRVKDFQSDLRSLKNNEHA